MRTRVKICGITRPEDAEAAARLGADAIGLVFAESSPRCVDVPRAAGIIAALPPFISVVGLFMNQAPERVAEVVAALSFDLLQFHGDETPDACRHSGLPYIKAVPMGGGADPRRYAQPYTDARALLLDGHVLGDAGGGGRPFAWGMQPVFHTPVILAGGLTPDNVAGAIAAVRPYAVDVSSGVESAKGIKDAAKIAAFMRGVREGDDTGR